MEHFIYIFIHIGIPVVLTYIIWSNWPKSRTGVISVTLFSVSLLGFLYLWGQWAIAVSHYFKFLLLALMVYALLKAWSSLRRNKLWFPKGRNKHLKNFCLLALGILFSTLMIRTYQGMFYTTEGVSLTFPLKNGTYYIGSGGSNAFANNHYGTQNRSQQYALDINKLGFLGSVKTRAKGSANESHAIFGESIYSPCDGWVFEMVNDVPDNAAASMAVMRDQGQGNYVSLDCGKAILTLVHLKYKSIPLRLGDYVREGSVIGQVGNSGFSQEPHLHLQAARFTKDSVLIGIPMSFGNTMPVRNDLIKK